MLYFFNYIAAIFIFFGKFRSRWLWFPAVICGIFFFWVFLSWNRVPSFCDKIEIIPICDTDRSSVSVSVKHPYFSFNNFNDDFWSFWSNYGTSVSGVWFTINGDSAYFHNERGRISCNDDLYTEIQQLFPDHSQDSIGARYEFRVRKELFGNMDSRKAHKKLIRAWDDKGFSVVKRTPEYNDNVCMDSIRVHAGANRFSSTKFPVGYRVKFYYTLLHLLRLEDISQFNYSLVLDDKASCMNSLELDFGGPIEIKGIWPIPDIIEPSRIVYHSKDKILQLKETKAVKMYCQSLESVNVQNVRLFILTTLASLCIAYTLKEIGVFILFCFGWVMKKYNTEKIEVETKKRKKKAGWKYSFKSLFKRINSIWQNKFHKNP